MRVQVPLSPTPQGPFAIYLFYPTLFVSGSNQSSLCFSFILFFSVLQAYPSRILLSYHKSCDILWYIYDIRTNQHPLSKEYLFVWMIHNPYHYSYWTEIYKIFLLKCRSKKFPFETFNLILFRFFVFIFNWHRPKSSSIMRIMRR